MTTIQIGHTYYGAGNERWVVVGIVGETVYVTHPLQQSHAPQTRTLAEMEEFIKGSHKRFYRIAETGEARIKLATAEDGSITYRTLNRAIETVTAEEWADWRKLA